LFWCWAWRSSQSALSEL